MRDALPYMLLAILATTLALGLSLSLRLTVAGQCIPAPTPTIEAGR